MFAKSKLNSIDTLISQSLIDMDISQKEFITILKEKDRYKMMKDNLRDKNGELYEIMRFNSAKSKIQKNIYIFFLCIYKRKILLSILCADIKRNTIEYFVLMKKIFFSGYKIECQK